jgi:tRNA pseudouridine38/39 synthase
MEEVIELRAQVATLQAELAKARGSQKRAAMGGGGSSEPRALSSAAASGRARKKPRRQATFDMSVYTQRAIVLKLAYLGANYRGFAMQSVTDETIEEKLFQALRKTCLIERTASTVDDAARAGYSRCARTDKGVSALCSIVALNVRSKRKKVCGDGDARIVLPLLAAADELDYVAMLNRVMPNDVRVLAWLPAPAEFDARFSCTGRMYRYFFMRRQLDLARMRAAAQRLVGQHDFRNFCKMDVVNVCNFVRQVLHCRVTSAESGSGEGVVGGGAGRDAPDGEVMCVEIKARGFLWHQVRCILAVLFAVGEGHEEPSVVDALLDVAAHPRKPNYDMAPPEPLVLYECSFDEHRAELEFDRASDAEALAALRKGFMSYYEDAAIHASLLRSALRRLDECEVKAKPARAEQAEDEWQQWGVCRAAQPAAAPAWAVAGGSTKGRWVPLLERPCAHSYDDKVSHVQGQEGKKRARMLRNLEFARVRNEKAAEAAP